jgi:hypothetical protein
MITFQRGQTVQRKDPGGDIVTRDIVTAEDVKYHTELQSRGGYTYTMVVDVPKTSPKVYTGEAVCMSCEG